MGKNEKMKCEKLHVGYMPDEIHLVDLMLHLLVHGYPNHKCSKSDCVAVEMFKIYLKKYKDKKVIHPSNAIKAGTKVMVRPTNCKFFTMCERTCIKKIMEMNEDARAEDNSK